MNVNPNGINDPANDQHGEVCFEDGHLPGCPGAAGGDHLVPPDWFEDEDGYLRAPLSYENREGDPNFNGAFNAW